MLADNLRPLDFQNAFFRNGLTFGSYYPDEANRAKLPLGDGFLGKSSPLYEIIQCAQNPAASSSFRGRPDSQAALPARVRCPPRRRKGSPEVTAVDDTEVV